MTAVTLLPEKGKSHCGPSAPSYLKHHSHLLSPRHSSGSSCDFVCPGSFLVCLEFKAWLCVPGIPFPISLFLCLWSGLTYTWLFLQQRLQQPAAVQRTKVNNPFNPNLISHRTRRIWKSIPPVLFPWHDGNRWDFHYSSHPYVWRSNNTWVFLWNKVIEQISRRPCWKTLWISLVGRALV